MADAYDKMVEWLRERPEKISNQWLNPFTSEAGALFSFCTTTRNDVIGNGVCCGCLTQVRNGQHAETQRLTEAIRSDDRLPMHGTKITVDHLPVFAEWQRLIDAELSRTPPVWREPEVVG